MKLEEKGRVVAAEKAAEQSASRIRKGSASQIPSRRTLIASGIPKMAVGIEAWIKQWEEGSSPGRKPAAFHVLKGHPAEQLAFLALRTLMNKIQTTDLKMAAVASELGRVCEAEVCFRKLREEKPAVWKWLEVNGRLDAATYLWRATTLKKAAQWSDLEWEPWDRKLRLQVGVSLLNILEATLGLVKPMLVIEPDKLVRGFPKKGWVYKLTPATEEWLVSQDFGAEWARPMLFPMIEEPIPWASVEDGGYVSLQLPMIKTANTEYLEAQCHRDLSVVMGAVNAVQRSAFMIVEDCLEILEHVWKADWRIKGIPELDAIPLPARPEGYASDSQEMKQWRVRTGKVHSQNTRSSSKRFSVLATIQHSKAFRRDNLYFPWQTDWRGRLYPAVASLSPHGPDFQRSLLTFAESKALTEPEQWDWLKIHGANCAGPAAKQALPDRVRWVDDNIELVKAIADDPLSNRAWTEMDKPFAFLAWALDFRGALETGRSSLPVAMDGSCSGLQHFSALLRDPVGALVTNLAPHAMPQDIYANVATRIEEICTADAKDGHKTAAQWLKSGLITRDLAKRPTMTTPYGVSIYGVQTQTSEWLRALTTIRGKEYFEEGTKGEALKYISFVIVRAIHGTVPKAMAAMRVIQDSTALLATGNIQAGWTLPSTGFQVAQNYLKMNKRRVKTILNGEQTIQLTLKMQQQTERVALGKAKAASAPNLIHSLDAAHLMMTVNAMEAQAPTPVSYVLVHDSFAVHAADAPLLARVLREQFVKLYEDPGLFAQILEQLKEGATEEMLAKWPEAPTVGDFDLQEVLSSDYCFA